MSFSLRPDREEIHAAGKQVDVNTFIDSDAVESDWSQKNLMFLLNLFLTKKNIIYSGPAASGKSILSLMLLRSYLKLPQNSTTLQSIGGAYSVVSEVDSEKPIQSNALICRAKDIVNHLDEDDFLVSSWLQPVPIPNLPNQFSKMNCIDKSATHVLGNGWSSSMLLMR